MTGHPPFMVQAYRKGQFTKWYTDSRHDTLAEAATAAERLHVDFDRKVRIIDQEEVVHLRLPGDRGRHR